MQKIAAVAAIAASLSVSACADTIVLSSGDSYSGQYAATSVKFTDAQGIQYTFPRSDIQVLAFNPSHDTVTLRSGKSYTGHFRGTNPISFAGAEGVQYEFPVKDVESVVFNEDTVKPPHASQNAKVIPYGRDLVVRTDETIDSQNAQTGHLFRATIVDRVYDAAGAEALPSGTPAKLLIRNESGGGKVSSADLVLDLYSVTIHGREYRVVTSNVDESSQRGIGKNRRTAEFLGGGTALGALMGGIFGGGKGAGIGALAGAGGGALTQIFTRGHQVKVPAESVLTFRLERRLVLEPR